MQCIVTCLALSFSLASLPVQAASQAVLEAHETGLAHSQMQTHYLQLNSKPVGPEELEHSRGGFVTPGNIQIDIGFESILMVDGVLHSQSKLSMDNLTAGQLSNLSMGMINFVENTTGNQSLNANTSGFLNQVIQNNMDNKLIQSIKVLDIELRGLGNSGQGTLHQMLNTQLIGALR